MSIERDRLWAWAERADLVGRYCHGSQKRDDAAQMWAMLCHAARVSQAADRNIPRTGFPASSPGAWLVADDVTWWQHIAAYLRGEVESVPDAPAKWIPDPIEVTLRDEVLDVWHRYALVGLGARDRLRKAVYVLACGQPMRRVIVTSGITRDRLRHARDRAARDMLEAWAAVAAAR